MNPFTNTTVETTNLKSHLRYNLNLAKSKKKIWVTSGQSLEDLQYIALETLPRLNDTLLVVLGEVPTYHIWSFKQIWNKRIGIGDPKYDRYIRHVIPVNYEATIYWVHVADRLIIPNKQTDNYSTSMMDTIKALNLSAIQLDELIGAPAKIHTSLAFA